MDTFLKDLQYGFRTLVKRPGFTAIALLALAIGIGANTSIFSVVNAVLLRPLDYKDPDRLVWITKDDTMPPADYLDYRSQNSSFENMAAFIGWGVSLSEGAEPERLSGTLVTSNYFSVLGVPASLGRTFVDGDDGASPRVTV